MRSLKHIPGVGALAALLCFAAPARADYPDRPVRLQVVVAPGASVDALARLVANRLSAKWKQNVIVENRAGADGTIAAEYVAGSAPDGTTLLFTYNALTVTANTYKLKYNPITSFVPINLVASTPTVLAVNPAVLPVKSLQELITYVKANPGKLSFGSGGSGSPVFLHMAMLMHLTGMDMVHVAYKGTAPALVDLLRGELQLAFGSVSAIQPYAEQGKLKPLGVSTRTRVPMMPDVPTIAEEIQRPFDETAWNGIFAPAGTPKEIINKIHADIEEAMSAPDAQKVLFDQGFVTFRNSPEEFADFVKADLAKWAGLWKTIQGN
jgi:tripartite-type tricarboxylate transporter receptor subunit TctC